MEKFSFSRLCIVVSGIEVVFSASPRDSTREELLEG